MLDNNPFAGEDPDPDSLPHLVPGTFYVVRHAQTVWNAVGRLQGQSNHAFTHLTACGKRDIARTAVLLREEGLTHFVSGGSYRAQQTLDILHNAIGCKQMRLDNALDERCFGMLEGKTMDEILALVGAPSRAAFEAAFEAYIPPCVESNSALVSRVVPAINKWCGVFEKKPVVFVTHKSTVRALAGYLAPQRPLLLENGMVGKFRYGDDGRWVTEVLGGR